MLNCYLLACSKRHVTCSNNAFKLEMEIDRSRIIALFGQVRDRLIILLRDEHERIVPDIMDWQITQCDINKDIKMSHLLHLWITLFTIGYLTNPSTYNFSLFGTIFYRPFFCKSLESGYVTFEEEIYEPIYCNS